jgi:hypothetical protein
MRLTNKLGKSQKGLEEEEEEEEGVMTEPDTKRRHLLVMEEREGRVSRVSYAFMSCGASECTDLERLLVSGDDTHAPVAVQLPNLFELGDAGIPLAVISQEAIVQLACCRWVSNYNEVVRFERITGGGPDGEAGWRYACLLLVKNYEWLRPALGVFKQFGQRYFIGRPLPIVDSVIAKQIRDVIMSNRREAEVAADPDNPHPPPE